MNKLVYIYVPNEFVIGYELLTLLIKRLAVALVNKTVGMRVSDLAAINNTDLQFS
jgi:hypothetical protein